MNRVWNVGNTSMNEDYRHHINLKFFKWHFWDEVPYLSTPPMPSHLTPCLHTCMISSIFLLSLRNVSGVFEFWNVAGVMGAAHKWLALPPPLFMAWADLETICTTAKLKSDRSRASGGYLLDVCNLPMEDGKLSSTSFLPLLHNKGSIIRRGIIWGICPAARVKFRGFWLLTVKTSERGRLISAASLSLQYIQWPWRPSSARARPSPASPLRHFEASP